VTALIEDDGRGFAASELGDDGLGLIGMRERIGLVGGRLTIESSAEGGTTLAVEVPSK
jgi:two-component system sensor histidine kinase NreB